MKMTPSSCSVPRRQAGVANPIHVARDGQEAIDYLHGTGKFADRSHFPLPGLVLLDLKLPFVMGLDVLKWIRQQPDFTPIVVILSSSRQPEDIAAAYRLGANAYLVKPAEMSKLDDMARALNDFWLTQNTPPPNLRVDQGLVTSAFSCHRALASSRWPLATNPPAHATFCQA